MPIFGTAGNPQAFYDAGYKSSVQMPSWLAGQGLFAYEYQCGRGVNISEETARQIGSAAASVSVSLSIHVPYYINLASEDPDKRLKTSGYILESLRAAKHMNASRVVIHPGSAQSPGGRSFALHQAKNLLLDTINEADEQGLLMSCTLCPETLGKNNQLGDLEEVTTLCLLDDRLIPCIDFVHLNARTQGGLKNEDDFREVCKTIEKALGTRRLRKMHVHFSHIEFTTGGEKQHHRLEDRQFGPDFEPFAQVMREMSLDPVIICESDGTQAKDAVLMKNIFEKDDL